MDIIILKNHHKLFYYLIKFSFDREVFPNIHLCCCRTSGWSLITDILILYNNFKIFLESLEVGSDKHYFARFLENKIEIRRDKN